MDIRKDSQPAADGGSQQIGGETSRPPFVTQGIDSDSGYGLDGAG